ncbi:MAG: hypothetical protein DWQ02_18100 [Bacteroidetes bacterium]|nr:MAG: hypothetical protein DWQ02_18100 [Bacteroidota bacterium]
MKLNKLLTPVIFALALGLFAFSCETIEPQPEPSASAKPVTTQLMDIDGDGKMELVVGFENTDVKSLESKEVILHGRLFSTNTRFETDPFDIKD